MRTAVRYLAAPLTALAIFGLVLTASADPFANVTVTLPPEGVGNIFSPGVVPVESLTVKGKKGGKGKKGKQSSKAYIEEEYFVEGTADVFMYDTPPELHELILRNDVPTNYKTRFIIRRPEAPKRFKDTVVVEWWNSTANFDTAPAWDASAEHFAERGWIYVGITNSNQSLPFLTSGCAVFPPFTPPTCGTRYASLVLPENGIAYEMVSQIVNLLRGNDPQNHAQDPTSWLGKLLRIDVDGASPYVIPPSNPFFEDPIARPEIWALGLRNPWRFSFDRETGDIFIGDVGQKAIEEIDFQPADSTGGENYGWRRMEGTS